MIGKELVINNNILDVAAAVDIAQFEHVTVRCNRKSSTLPSHAANEDNCPRTINVPLMPKFTMPPEINANDQIPNLEPGSAALGNYFLC